MDRPYQSVPPPDLRLAILAADQEGMVATRQLLALGFNKAAIQVRVRRGQLHLIHRGVYAVGHAAVTLRGRFMAAVLACGEDAFLTRFSAGTFDGYLTWDDRRPEVLVLG